MDGYDVEPLVRAVARSDFVVTVTGDKHVLDREHFAFMKDGCIIANAGHFNVEINIPVLEEMSVDRHRPRPSIDEYRLPDGRRIRLLAEGRLVNLAAAEGHPAAVMDMSFANQALSVAWLAQQRSALDAAVHPVPRRIDEEVARLKLSALGMTIDTLTDEQEAYLHTWQEGT
jgi:adenosylhomocysteinase